MTDLAEDLYLISGALGPVVSNILGEGLPSGASPEWGYDEGLIADIAEAIRDWQRRRTTT